jgi:hypothetical protein
MLPSLRNARPPIPDFFDVMFFSPNAAYANVSARQLALEPSVSGVDGPRSWSLWVEASNIGTGLFRVFGCALTTSTTQQYALQIQPQSSTDATNQKMRFVLFTDGSNFIFIETTNKFLRNRWTHVVVTYSGSETSAGLNIYLNGVLDSTAVKSGSGAYTGALNNSSLRFTVSNVFTATSRFAGDMRDLAVWTTELDQTKVTTLYNLGIPIDVDTVSFYGSDIASYWPLRTTLTSTTNSIFNFVSDVGITTRNIPVGPDYNKISIFNGVPVNSRYISFGGMFKPFANKFHWNGRSGTSHLANGKIVKLVFDQTDMSVTAPLDIITDGTYDLRGGSAGIINSLITNLATRYTTAGAVFVDQQRWESTDGFTGETFGSPVSMTVAGTSFNFYGKIVEGYTSGEFLVPQFEFVTPNFLVNIWKRDTGGTWSKQNIYSGASAQLTECSLCRVGNNTFFCLVRNNAGSGLYLIYSTDGGATWSAPFATGLGTGVSNADMALDHNDKLVVIYMDRATGGIYITIENAIADIIADPTAWNSSSRVFQGYSTDSTVILGYPCIVRDGFNWAIAFSSEFSSSRADIYFGYGILGLGI